MTNKNVYLLFSGRSDESELLGVHATKISAQVQGDRVREDGIYPHVSTRSLSKKELENLLEEDLSDEQWERWGCL